MRFLEGGNAAWRAAGYPFSTEAKMADEAIDQWRKPYERTGDTEAAMREYLAWETDLLPRIARDGSLKFAIPLYCAASSRISASRSGISTITSWPQGTP